jgi:hypothetical protein
VSACAALVSPTGQVAITSRLPRGELAELELADPLDHDWLPIVAAVRAPLARVETHQLAAGSVAAAGPALVPWSTKPADPWQTDAGDGRRLVVAYAAGAPDLSIPLDDETLLAIVRDARELAHARMARPADLPGDVAGLLPTALLPANGAIAIPLT